jgi:hypothetical protein
MPPQPDLLQIQIDYFRSVDRLLAEADRLRALRDRLFSSPAAERHSRSRTDMPPQPEEAAHV